MAAATKTVKTTKLTPAKTAKISPAKKKKLTALANNVVEHLSREFPDAECALHHKTAAQLLFATMLSAQCTDVAVNKATPALFKAYPSVKAMAEAKVGDVEKLIRSIGLYKNKAKNLVACAQLLMERHKGRVPKTMDELSDLPGVGRKTANVVLGNAFGIPGMVVDTHVKRLSQLIGLTEHNDPVKIEYELMEIVPKEHWTQFSHWLILHGRSTCPARRPKCDECVIKPYCEYGRKA